MKHHLFFIILFVSAGFFSCRTPRYINAPTAVNAPVLKEKGDSKLAAYYSSNFGNSNEDFGSNYNKSRGYDLQAAYAINNHWALQANYASRSERNGGFNQGSFDSSAIIYKRKSGDVGIGYFTPTGKGNVFQIFAGAGKGTSEMKDVGSAGAGLYNRFHTSNINKFYLQPAFIIADRNFALTLASRFSFLHYNKISTDYTPTEQLDFNLSNLENKTLSFWEPALILSFGFSDYPPLKLEFQFGGSYSIDNNYYDSRTGNASVGVVYDLSKLRKK